MIGDVTRPQRTDAASSPGHPYLDDWRTFLQAHALISRRLDEELRAEQSMSLAEYDALVQLALAPERRLRMSQLADRVLLSRSGVTRLVDRLVAAGFVDRTQCTTDARGAEAVITELGLTRLRRASRTHLRGIDHYFIGPLSEDELGAIGRSLGTIVDVLRGGASAGGGGRSDQTDEADLPADGPATTDEGRVARRPKIESSEAAPV
jgi:DNA-binding MarR family transcriptional regulator